MPVPKIALYNTMVIDFVKGYFIDCIDWDMSGKMIGKSHSLEASGIQMKPATHVIFVLDEEIDEYLERLRADFYESSNNFIFYRLIKGVLSTRVVKSKMPKTYPCQDGKIVYWGKYVPIQRQ